MIAAEATAELASLVRTIRVARGLTQEGLARELGVSFATINAWENGRHHPAPALEKRLRELADRRADAGLSAGGPTAGKASDSGEASSSPVKRSVVELVASAGWPFDGRDRRDLYHRPREFSPTVRRWRAEMVRAAIQDGTRFPRSHGLVRGKERTAAIEQTRALVDDGISYLREIARIMAILYGTPDLGNKKDPVDELVYIILSRKTREEAYQQAFQALKTWFSSWDELLDAEYAEVEAL